MSTSPLHLSKLLSERKSKGLFRALKSNYPEIDFSSNDYLGFSRNDLISNSLIIEKWKSGASGSRLISGNSVLFENTEKEIAQFHHADAALLFNSGYDANLGLLSSVPQKEDLILFDELIHASIYDGIRLSYAKHYKFRHNDLEHLRELLSRHRNHFNEIYIVVESVYSMDGDSASLKEIADLTETYHACLIVDEAHAIGVFGEKGKGLCQELGIEQKCFARIYTYGKAMGCHGASIVGSEILREYLINFARSFIYTTAMPEHSLWQIKTAYDVLKKTAEIGNLKHTIQYFNSAISGHQSFIYSQSAIHCKLISGNAEVQKIEDVLASKNIFAKSIKSPTVKAGKERIRVCLHVFNTKEEIDNLLSVLI